MLQVGGTVWLLNQALQAIGLVAIAEGVAASAISVGAIVGPPLILEAGARVRGSLPPPPKFRIPPRDDDVTIKSPGKPPWLTAEERELIRGRFISGKKGDFNFPGMIPENKDDAVGLNLIAPPKQPVMDKTAVASSDQGKSLVLRASPLPDIRLGREVPIDFFARYLGMSGGVIPTLLADKGEGPHIRHRDVETSLIALLSYILRIHPGILRDLVEKIGMEVSWKPSLEKSSPVILSHNSPASTMIAFQQGYGLTGRHQEVTLDKSLGFEILLVKDVKRPTPYNIPPDPIQVAVDEAIQHTRTGFVFTGLILALKSNRLIETEAKSAEVANTLLENTAYHFGQIVRAYGPADGLISPRGHHVESEEHLKKVVRAIAAGVSQIVHSLTGRYIGGLDPRWRQVEFNRIIDLEVEKFYPEGR